MSRPSLFASVHRRASTAIAISIAAATMLSGCITQPDSRAAGWRPSAAAEAAGAARVKYDDAPLWDDGANCAGALTPAAEELGAFLQSQFPQIARVYGYECRPNTAIPSETSQHGTGRAIDLAIPTLDGQADSALGDPIAEWLVTNSAEIGVQLIIWDRGIWISDSSAPRADAYQGPDPHIDHLHVEINLAAANRATGFFQNPDRFVVNGTTRSSGDAN